MAMSLLLVLSLSLVGCAPKSSSNQLRTETGKTIIRVSMFNSSSFPEWRAYVQDRCPDVYIQWENNRNVCSNVVYEAEHDDMADIVCIRKFDSDSARQLEPYLADLSGMDLTDTFKPQALIPFQDDGKQYWLPEPGTMEGMFANADLFARFGIATPTDMSSFISACKTLQENGVAPFAADCSTGYTSVSLMEGFGAAGYLGTEQGTAYRSAFESGDATQVDYEGYSSIFNTLRTLRDNGILTQKSTTETANAIGTQFLNGQIGISKRSSDGMFGLNTKYNFTALPYFGETADDSCLFTYPVFSVSLSKDAASDTARSAACSQVMNAMMDADAQAMLNLNTAGLISYSKDVSLQLQPSMESVKPLIENDKYYIRSMNSNSFSASNAAMKSLIDDGADNQSIISGLNQNLFKVTQPVTVGESKVEASTVLDQHLCSPAGSVLAQTVKDQTDSDIAIVDSREAACPVYKGTYTDLDVNALVVDGNVYQGDLTGAEIRLLMKNCILYTTTFSAGQIEPDIDYPALAGMTVAMQKTGVIDEITTGSGSALDNSATYKVVIGARIYNALVTNGNGISKEFAKQDKTLSKCLVNELSSQSGLPKPGDYYVVR